MGRGLNPENRPLNTPISSSFLSWRGEKSKAKLDGALPHLPTSGTPTAHAEPLQSNYPGQPQCLKDLERRRVRWEKIPMYKGVY